MRRYLWTCGLLLALAGCRESFMDLTRTDGTRMQRFYAKAIEPEGTAFLVPAEEISQAQAQQRLGFYEAIYDHAGRLQILRRHVQTAYGLVVQMERRYFCDSAGRLVRELIRARDNQGRIHNGERIYDEKGNLIAQRELDALGRPIPMTTDQP